jgi:uracil-DNA glycosylase
MNPSAIPTLLKQLASTTVANPYSSPACLINISIYLNALCALPFSGHLLLGEAPGHKGCALTGIPFTSQRVLTSSIKRAPVYRNLAAVARGYRFGY